MGIENKTPKRPDYDPVTRAVESAQELAERRLRKKKAGFRFFAFLGQALAGFPNNLEAHRASKGNDLLKKTFGEEEEEEE